MTKESLKPYLENASKGFEDPKGGFDFYRGKVRDVFSKKDKMLISVSDRISAFDRVLSSIPCKGQVLNEIAIYWFEQTADIIGNHIITKVSPRSSLVRKCEVLPLEIIVRGYLTGSAWRDYKKGEAISGIKLPSGLKLNCKFDGPLFTPSTKEELGKHDQPISYEEIVSSGLLEQDLIEEVKAAALALFKRGSDLAAERGLILVDTKYEFGILDGKLVVVDEMHTPDSSRFWYSDTYRELYNAEKPQRKIDKEYFRQWLMEKGFSGEGRAPEIPDEVRLEVAFRYIKAFEEITGKDFVPQEDNFSLHDIEKALS